MKKILLFIFILAFGIHAFSQIGQSNLLSEVKTLSIRNMSNTLDYNHIEGSPYFDHEFIQGTVYLKDGQFTPALLRYDIFQDEMEFVNEKQIFWLNKKDVKFIRYGSQMLTITNSKSETGDLKYFFIKGTGNYNLLIRKIIEYFPSESPKGYSQVTSDSFKPGKDEVYLQYKESPAHRIRGKKDLSTFFNSDKVALYFIKKEKIKPASLGDLHKLVLFLNSGQAPDNLP